MLRRTVRPGEVVTPFYWNDLDGRPAWDVWLYRLCASIGFGCFIGVAVAFVLIVAVGIAQALGA